MAEKNGQIAPINPLLEPGHYVTHLSEVNQRNEVCSTEDIFNDRGVLLLRKGAAINHSAAERIIQHKLCKPLEEQITVTNGIERDRLMQYFDHFIAKYPDVQQIHEKLNFKADLRTLITHWDYPSILTQKLTVMAEQMEVEFEKGLFSAWLSALIGREMGLKKDLILATFVAGLVHDIGLMHIDPSILKKQGQLSPSEWRAIQSHTVIGKLLVEHLRDANPEIARAILEHHERCDGVGYPGGKREERLGVPGQIVGMADSIQAIRVNQFKQLGRSLRDTQSFLHMNSRTHFYPTYEAMCAILKKSELAPTRGNPFGTIPKFVDHLLGQGRILKEVVNTLEPMRGVLQMINVTSPTGKALLTVSDHVLEMITSSGLVRDDLFLWLESLARHPDEEALSDLNDIELMLNELNWQLKNANRAYGAFKESGCDLPECEMLHNLAMQMSNALDKQPRHTDAVAVPIQ